MQKKQGTFNSTEIFHHEETKDTKKVIKFIFPSLLARLRETLLKKWFFLKLFSENFCLFSFLLPL